MPVAAELKASTGASVAADIETALATPGWRRELRWPVTQREANEIAAGQVGRALTWACGLDDRLARDAVLVALPNILAYGRTIVIAALAVRRLNANGGRFASTTPEIAYLQSGAGSPPSRSDPVLPAEPLRFGFARRAARCHSWTGAARLLPALLSPSAVAVAHNALLRSEAGACGAAVGYRHADSFLIDARRRSSSDTAPQVTDLAQTLARSILGGDLLEDEYGIRAGQLLEAMVPPHLEKAARDIAALRAIQLPAEIWSGSGGLYAPRAVGLEILRRGGRVVRFDHGTPRGFVEATEITALLELSVSSEFVVATDGAATICRGQTAGFLAVNDYGTRIRGATGDPDFARVPAKRTNRAGGSRPRVVYAPTQLLGFRQLLPVQAPDPIYLDWQLQVAERLLESPVNLVCQPHPEGFFRNRRHPLEDVAPTERGNFERQLDEADVFVFDYPSTTALWQAACTDARIVFLDIGAGRMSPKIARLFAERATVIQVDHDDCNRPVLDGAQLCDAVLADEPQPDPSPFRRLLAGEA